MRHRLVIATIVLGIGTLAQGSTPEAWAQHDRQVEAACVAASHLRQAHLAGDLIEFEDEVGYTAALVVGRYPQPHMNNRPGRVLCLFDKRAGLAHVSVADGIIHSHTPPAYSDDG